MVKNPLPRLILVITFTLVFGTGAILSPYLNQTTVWAGVGGACVCWILGVLGWFSTKDRSEHKEPERTSEATLRRKHAELSADSAMLRRELKAVRVERDAERDLRRTLQTQLRRDTTEGLTNTSTTLGWHPTPPKPKPKKPPTIYDRINEDE